MYVYHYREELVKQEECSYFMTCLLGYSSSLLKKYRLVYTHVDNFLQDACMKTNVNGALNSHKKKF